MKREDEKYQSYLKSSKFVELSDHSSTEDEEIITISSSSSSSDQQEGKRVKIDDQASNGSTGDDDQRSSDLLSTTRRKQLVKDKEILARNIMRYEYAAVMEKGREDYDEAGDGSSTSSEPEIATSSSTNGASATPTARPNRECRSLYKQLMHGQAGTLEARTNKLEGEVQQAVLWNAASFEETKKEPSIEEGSDRSSEMEFQTGNGEESSDSFHPDADGDGDGAAANANTEAVIDSFCTWLLGVDGGCRDRKTARQYASQVFNIVKTVDPNDLNIHCLLAPKKVRDKWLEKVEKKRRPGTCKTYLASLSKFQRFLMIESPASVKSTQEVVRQCKEQVTEWMASYKAPLGKRKWQKQQEDLEKLVTPEDVRKFDTLRLASTRAH